MNKRRRTPSVVANNENYSNWMDGRRGETVQQRLNNIYLEHLNKLIRHDRQKIFRYPVDVSIVTDYHAYISTPMDFETMLKKIQGHYYQEDPTLFDNDIYLIIKNCQTYNSQNSIFYQAAERLKEYYEKMRPLLVKRVNESITRRKKGQHTPVQTVTKTNENPLQHSISSCRITDVDMVAAGVPSAAQAAAQAKRTHHPLLSDQGQPRRQQYNYNTMQPRPFGLPVNMPMNVDTMNMAMNVNMENMSAAAAAVVSQPQNFFFVEEPTHDPYDAYNLGFTSGAKKKRRKSEGVQVTTDAGEEVVLQSNRTNPLIHATQAAITSHGLTDENIGHLTSSSNGITRLANALGFLQAQLLSTPYIHCRWFQKCINPLLKVNADFAYKRTAEAYFGQRPCTFDKIKVLLSKIKRQPYHESLFQFIGRENLDFINALYPGFSESVRELLVSPLLVSNPCEMKF